MSTVSTIDESNLDDSRHDSNQINETSLAKHQPVHNIDNYDPDPDLIDVDEDASNECVFGHRTRYIILILAALCLSSMLSNILTLNFTIICMSDDEPQFSNSSDANYSIDLTSRPTNKFIYTQLEKSLLFASVAVGALLVIYPIIWLLNRTGPRRVFSLIGFISALSTCAIPTAARLGFPYLLATRAVQGIGLAACLPVIGCVTAHWATLKQNGIFIAILSSFLQLAPIFTMPIAGELCVMPSLGGWQSVYYVHAGVSVILFGAFLLYYRDAPVDHSNVSARELSKITIGKTAHDRRRVPYQAIMSSSAIWAVWIAAIGSFTGTQLTLQFTPIYLNKVLHIPVEQTGQLSALPPAIMFAVKLTAGLTSDRLRCAPENLKIRIYNSMALGGMAVFLIALAYVPTTETLMSLATLAACSCMLGCNSGGFFKSAQLVARHHSHFVMGNVSMVNCVCMLAVPFLVDWLTPNDAPMNGQWYF